MNVYIVSYGLTKQHNKFSECIPLLGKEESAVLLGLRFFLFFYEIILNAYTRSERILT